MFGLSPAHLILILVVVILLFGTSKLKNLGKDLGGAIKGFKESVKDEETAKLEQDRTLDGNAQRTQQHDKDKV